MSAESWISARGGKWHVAAGIKPQWDRTEDAKCGASFTPLNVTWEERPPTNMNHICLHCKPEWKGLTGLAKDKP